MIVSVSFMFTQTLFRIFYERSVLSIRHSNPKTRYHCVKYQSFPLCKSKLSPEFRAIRSKFSGSFAIQQNFHTRKLGNISVFYSVFVPQIWASIYPHNQPIHTQTLVIPWIVMSRLDIFNLSNTVRGTGNVLH